MTIREIETLSGMTRANIRFYETEGLLSPQRSGNGYRDYSEADLETLSRIRLLRVLHVSLEDIRALQEGKRKLSEVLEEQMEKLEAAREDIGKSREICELLCREGVEYQSMHAGQYLTALESAAGNPLIGRRETTGNRIPPESEDRVPAAEGEVWEGASEPILDMEEAPRLYAPWRRLAARTLDYVICGILWDFFLMFVLHINIYLRNGIAGQLDIFAAAVLMLFLEPLLLCVFKTTPGKWVLGFRVTDNEGGRLTLPAAFARTRLVLWHGMGFYIPVYQLIRLWKSYQKNRDGRTLKWEFDSELSLRDEKGWRIGAYAASYAVCFCLLSLGVDIAQMPRHRGELTVEQFCENYNAYADYCGFENVYELDERGKWAKKRNYGAETPTPGGGFRPDYCFTERDGHVTGVEFLVEIAGSEEWVGSYQNEILLLAYSFVKAQESCGPFSGEGDRLTELIASKPFGSFETSVCGVDIVCEVEYSGYADTGAAILVPVEEDSRFRIYFSMRRSDAASDH